MDLAAPLVMPRQNGEMAVYGNDNSLMVQFYKEAVFMEFETEKAGKPVYKEFDFISIVQPGGKSDVKRRVKLEPEGDKPSDPERFPRQWARFQSQHAEVHDGLPLDQCPFMPKAEILSFKAGGIHTVEQLSNIPDSALHNFGMMGRKWRDMALNYLARAEGSKDMTALVAENEKLKGDVEALKAQFAELAATQKRGPGRPRKEETENDD